MSNPIYRVISRIFIPIIIIFAFYIQMHGEISPGGGFQAGAILAAAIILHNVVFENFAFKPWPSLNFLVNLAALGCLTYWLTGFLNMLQDGKFLQYSTFSKNNILAQKIGIIVIELGVGMTVFAVFMIIYYLFIKYIKD